VLLSIQRRRQDQPGVWTSLVLEERDWRELVYTMAANPVREVWIGGEKVLDQGAMPMEVL
jgi:hypothetical protein